MTDDNSRRSSNMRAARLAALAPLLGLQALACQAIGDDTPADLGNTDVPQVTLPPAQPPFALELQDFIGRWEGVAEDALALTDSGEPALYRFPSGSSRILLELSETDGVSVGTLTFGEGDVPPPPTDPDVGYPVGVDYAELLRYDVAGLPPVNFGGDLAFERGPLPPHEGFPYEVLRPDVSPEAPVLDGLLRLSFYTTQVLGDWCALQTSFPTPDGTFSCNPGAPLSSLDGGCHMIEYPVLPACDAAGHCAPPVQARELGPVDCNKAFLCDEAVPRCECNELNCSNTPELAELTVRPIGDELVGVIGGAAFQNARNARSPVGTLRFRRVP
jgi:hypothetical protein